MNPQIEDRFNKIDLMRKNGLYCDVTLVAKDMEIRAHKIILASGSEYFNKTFFEMKEKSRLSLREIDGKILLDLINYIYNCRSEIDINITNVQNFLAGAKFLKLKNITMECCKYLESNLNINTSLEILLIAEHHKYMDLLNKVEDFIDRNIIEIMNTQEFLNLSFDKLTRLISKNTLEVSSQEKIYEGIISWIKHDLNTRTKYLSVLMKHIRLTLISHDYLIKEVINEPLVKNNLESSRLIKMFLLSENITIDKPRKLEESSKTLLVMGGSNKNAKGTFEFYDFQTNRRSEIYSMPSEIASCSLTVVNGKIYVVELDNIKEYDLENNRWGNSTKINSVNNLHGVCVLNDCIYTAKGKFNISTEKWSSIASMSTDRGQPAVGVLNGLLYAVADGRIFASKIVEFYDPILNDWKRCSDLIAARAYAAVGILHNKMYVIGGRNGNKYLNSVEYYSSETNEFIQSAPLNFPRCHSTAIEFNNKLYVIGGKNESGELDTIEVYCPEINKWELLSTTMNVGRYRHGAVIIDKSIEFEK